MTITKIILGCCLLFSFNAFSQNPIQLLTEQKGISLRGLSIPNDSVIWASGSKGTIAKSVNAGKHFEWMQVKGFEQRDFRSIHAWNDQEAIIATIAAPGIILKTSNGGLDWKIVYENNDTAVFLDAIHFKNETEGIIVGDPIKQQFFLLKTIDKGAHWNQVANQYFKSPLLEGEAFFASSGSNIASSSDQIFIVSGGMVSRLWINGIAKALPIVQGKNSTGANSITISPNGNHLLIVGGDFTNYLSSDKNIVGLNLYVEPYSNNKHLSIKNKFWELTTKIGSPHGYKSSVQYVTNKLVVATGTSGVDISTNGGKSWNLISSESFHVVQKQPNKKGVFLAGAGGRIGYLNME